MVFVRNDGKIDERVEGENLPQLLHDGLVAEIRIIECEADGRVVVNHFPAVLPVSVSAKREFE